MLKSFTALNTQACTSFIRNCTWYLTLPFIAHHSGMFIESKHLFIEYRSLIVGNLYARLPATDAVKVVPM